MHQLVSSHSALPRYLCAKIDIQNVQTAHTQPVRALKKQGYIRQIQALSLGMLVASAGASQTGEMRGGSGQGTQLSSMLTELCKAEKGLDDIDFEAVAMKKGWFRSSESGCGRYLLESSSGSAKLAVDFEKALCRTMDELMAEVTNEPECDLVKKVIKTKADFEEALIPGVINSKGFSASLSGRSLKPCVAKMATVIEHCGQSYEKSAKRSDYERGIWALATLGALMALVAETFASLVLDGNGRPKRDIEYERRLGADLGKYNLIPNSFGLVAAVLKPVAQAVVGNMLGGQVIKLLRGEDPVSTLNNLDAKHYTLLGALPFVAFALVNLMPKFNRSRATQGRARGVGHKEFLKALTRMQIPSGFYMRNGAALLGGLVSTTGKQTFAETMACLGAAQLVHPLVRPVLYGGGRIMQTLLMNLSEELHQRDQADLNANTALRRY